jgi:hypothetical protein
MSCEMAFEFMLKSFQFTDRFMIATEQEQELLRQVQVGSIVRHFKGKKMKVLAVARHSEDLSLYVVYQKLYYCERFGDHAIFVRPLAMFLEKVVHDGVEVPRFQILPC